jgi:hypothetical protein
MYLSDHSPANKSKITEISEHQVSTKKFERGTIRKRSSRTHCQSHGAVSFISTMKSLFTLRRFTKRLIRNAQCLASSRRVEWCYEAVEGLHPSPG